MHLTVGICTRNRSAALADTLGALTRLVVPAGLSWDLIVADNGSEDATPATIASFSAILPVRAITVPQVGKSHALNATMQQARGDYILWTDDDVRVDPGWMTAYHSAFLRWPADAFFGGPIVPLFEPPSPQWLAGALRHVANAYAARDLGGEACSLGADTLPYGANWAIRTTDQRRHSYDPRLGPRGKLKYAGEEWAVMQALLADGESGRWVPDARVQHVISPARQTVRYLRRYYIGNGRSLARVRPPGADAMLFGRPRWVWREAFGQELAYRVRRIYSTSDVWSEHLRRASVAWGMLKIAAPPD
jgi:glycosyltransferase involved in cell wall biosynthesis